MMTNLEHHNKLQKDVTETWNELLTIDKEPSDTKWFADLQDVPKYNSAYTEWQKAQINYISFMTNSKGLDPHDVFVLNEIKDFGVWIPSDINDIKSSDKCFILHNSAPHTSMEKIFKGTRGECEKYASENVKIF